MAKSLYETLGVAKNASAGRDQEGVPEAGAREPPGPQPGRRGRRGALQGDPVRLRRPQGRRTSASSTTPSARRTGGPGQGAGPQGFGGFDFDLGDLFGGLFGGRRGGDARRPASRGRTRRRRRGEGQPLLRGLAPGRRDAHPGRARDRLPRLRRHRREAGHLAAHLPRLQRPRRARREPGPVRALAAVPALPRQRHRGRRAVPALHRHRPRAPDEALQRQDPGGRQGRHADPAQGQGRARRGRRAGGRPLRRHARRRRRRSTSAAAPTS